MLGPSYVKRGQLRAMHAHSILEGGGRGCLTEGVSPPKWTGPDQPKIFK